MVSPSVIWVVSPPGYLHSRCFEEVALALRAAFAALGRNVPIVADRAAVKGCALVLGANLLPRITGELPPQMILYNLEQIEKSSPWLKEDYVRLLQRYPVWDYSCRNIDTLKREYGVKATLCGIGYMPELTRITPQPKDIDVLFIGSLSDRRRRVLEEIGAAGKQVAAAFNSYGQQRDALIARAKIVLNLHYYDAQVFEIVRVSYLLANRTCVVSEAGRDRKLEAPFAGGVAFASYEGLAATCLRLLEDGQERKRLADKGFTAFCALSQVEMLETALAASG